MDRRTPSVTATERLGIFRAASSFGTDASGSRHAEYFRPQTVKSPPLNYLKSLNKSDNFHDDSTLSISPTALFPIATAALVRTEKQKRKETD